MTEIGYFTPPTAGFVNRSTTLLVAGIFFIIAGAMAGCGGILSPLALIVQRQTIAKNPSLANTPQATVGSIVVAIAVYAALSAILITLGIGAIRKRRWVRPIVLAGAWMLLIGGLLGIATLALRLPGMAAGMRQAMTPTPGTPAPPPVFVNIMIGAMLVFALGFYVVVPALLIWMFKSDDVRLTLEHFDPKPRWTDAIPLPAMIIVLALAISAAGTLAMVPQGWLPAFGSAIYGAPAVIAGIMLMILFAVATGLAVKLRAAGLWLGLGLWIAYGVSWVVTLCRADMRAVYERAGMPSRQIEMMEKMHSLPDATMGITSAAFMLVIIGFALWASKYFKSAASPSVAG